MMRNTITRKLSTSKIHAFKLDIKEGKPVVENLPEIVLAGELTEKQAIKELSKIYGKDNSIKIGKIEIDRATYEISVDDFMRCAKKVESPEQAEN